MANVGKRTNSDSEEIEDWYDDEGKSLPPITQRILTQVADIICDGDENVVLAAKRLKAEVERLRKAGQGVVDYLDGFVSVSPAIWEMSHTRKNLLAALDGDGRE